MRTITAMCLVALAGCGGSDRTKEKTTSFTEDQVKAMVSDAIKSSKKIEDDLKSKKDAEEREVKDRIRKQAIIEYESEKLKLSKMKDEHAKLKEAAEKARNEYLSDLEKANSLTEDGRNMLKEIDRKRKSNIRLTKREIELAKQFNEFRELVEMEMRIESNLAN